VNSSFVSVESGEIKVVASMADLLVCQRLGGRFTSASQCWVWPATPENAALLGKHLRAAQATPEFQALLALPPKPYPDAPTSAPSAEVVPAEVQTEIAIPDGMLTGPWRHQMAAFKFCLDKFASGFRGLLLACGMGTGKSMVACMLILALAARRVLIACPLRVVQVWLSQFERHVGVPVVIVALDEDARSVSRKRDLAAEKLKLAVATDRPFIAVINYDSAWRDPFAAWAEKVNWDLVVADEAHRLKRPGGKASLFFKRLRARAAHRIGLTGTPMPHGPMDIYAQFRFLDISIFGPSFSAFRQKYAVMGGYQKKQITGFQRLDELESLMSRITFRVGAEVLDLPPATHMTYTYDLSPEAARIYRDLEEDFVARVQDGTVTAANALVKLLRLQQLTGGCVPTDDGTTHRIDTSKQKLLADTLEDIGSDEPVVVFCRFHADLDAVHQACKGMGRSTLELSGRRDELKRWQDGEAQVLAVQISAGGVGVDLTRARFNIFYSLSFSLGEYDQALARIHRPGQTKPVEHIHLVIRNSIDTKILRALEKRAEVVNAILAEIKN
jgi:SNF2 family DNA or RNA helicase